MIRNDSRSGSRSAFTLVELLVVVLIIAILVSLIGSAVLKAMQKIPEVQTRTEIAEMAVALQAFMSDYNLNEPPPSSLILSENISWYGQNQATNPLAASSWKFLQRVFGKSIMSTPLVDWNGDGVQNGPWTLQGHQCLVFYLGGIPSNPSNSMTPGAQPAGLGFSTSNAKPSMGSMTIDYQAGGNPAGLPGALGNMGKRKGPYFTFVTGRLVPSALPTSFGFYSYLDPWQVKTGPMPYVYFSSQGQNNNYSITDCNTVVFTDALGSHFALPYWTGVSGTTLTFSNSNTYQIISAGRDGMFGYNPGLPQPNNLWVPASGAVGTGADDQANFSGSLLGSGQS